MTRKFAFLFTLCVWISPSPSWSQAAEDAQSESTESESTEGEPTEGEPSEGEPSEGEPEDRDEEGDRSEEKDRDEEGDRSEEKDSSEETDSSEEVDSEGRDGGEERPTEAEAKESQPWADIKDTKFDWVRMTSGEWLKGELKEIRDGDLVIDSDEFDLQTVSFSDVDRLHSPNTFSYVNHENEVFSGPAHMQDGEIVISTAQGPKAIPQAELLSAVSYSQREIQNWSFNLTLGANFTRGNSDIVDYSAFSRLRREDAFHRATLEYRGAYGLVSDETSRNNHRGTATWNIFISPVFYLTPFRGDLYYDSFQNIETQVIAASGVGFHIVDTDDVTFDLELAAGYVGTTYLSVEPGEDPLDRGGVAIPRLVFEWDLTDDIEFELDWWSAIVFTQVADTFHTGRAAFTAEITDILDFGTSATYSRRERPVTDEDGNTPQKDDIALQIGLGIELD